VAGSLQRFCPALAALCLWVVATGVPADNARNDRTQAPTAVINTSPTIHGLERARQRSDGALVVSEQVSGTGRVNADHVIIEGTLSPGNSPGCIDFGGNVTFSVSASLLVEIGGSTPCTEHDRISVANTLTISGATLELVLINNFIPAFGDRFDIMDWGSLAGSFGNIDSNAASLPSPLSWDTSQLYLTGELVVDVLHFADGDLAPWNSPDGQVNAADVLIASQLLLGQRSKGPLQYAHGDMNMDGEIDLTDLLLIQQAALQ
jgi:hypothetical protein